LQFPYSKSNDYHQLDKIQNYTWSQLNLCKLWLEKYVLFSFNDQWEIQGVCPIDQCQQTQKLGISSVCITKKDEMENHEIEGISNYLKSDSLPLLKLWKKKILKPVGWYHFFIEQ
jgi:hypothetical protein